MAQLFSELTHLIPNLHYKDPKKNQYNSLSVYINLDQTSGNNFSFQVGSVDNPSSACKAPFGISEQFDKNKPIGDRQNLEFQCNDPEFIAFIRTLEANHIKVATQNCEKWFKRSISPEKLAEMFKSCIQVDPTGQYPPRVRSKVSLANCPVWKLVMDKDNNPTVYKATTADITQGCTFIPILEASSLWFMAKEYGTTLNLNSVLLLSKGKSNDFSFAWSSSLPPPVIMNAPEPAKSEDAPMDGDSGDNSSGSATDQEYQAALAAGKAAEGNTRGNRD